MKTVRENRVEKFTISKFREIGMDCIKFLPDDKVGMPDRLVLLPDGKVMWVELKTIGGELSAIQKYRHQKLRSLGHRVEVVWTREQADALVSGTAKEYGREYGHGKKDS